MMQKKLAERKYKRVREVRADVELMLNNCEMYNSPRHFIVVNNLKKTKVRFFN